MFAHHSLRTVDHGVLYLACFTSSSLSLFFSLSRCFHSPLLAGFFLSFVSFPLTPATISPREEDGPLFLYDLILTFITACRHFTLRLRLFLTSFPPIRSSVLVCRSSKHVTLARWKLLFHLPFTGSNAAISSAAFLRFSKFQQLSNTRFHGFSRKFAAVFFSLVITERESFVLNDVI